MFIGALGGCLPDMDAISLWSGFDATFGKLLDLQHPGQEIYFGKYWYSHHGFFHSIAAIGFYLMVYAVFRFIRGVATGRQFQLQIPTMIAFSGGYLAHILEDLPTPALSWGGVNLFWPSSEWVGGTGQIWWWNNYDVFLIVVTGIVVNLIFNFITFRFKRMTSWFVLIMATLFIIIQINTRNYDFNIKNGYEPRETVSLEIQRKILGDEVFNLMVKLDNLTHLNF